MILAVLHAELCYIVPFPCPACLCVYYSMLLTVKYFGKRYPKLKWLRPLGPISACVVAIIAVVAGNLQDKGIKIVGHIPAGASAILLAGDARLTLDVRLWLCLVDCANVRKRPLIAPDGLPKTCSSGDKDRLCGCAFTASTGSNWRDRPSTVTCPLLLSLPCRSAISNGELVAAHD